MNDDMIKQLMTAYVYAEMDALKPELLEGYDHDDSKGARIQSVEVFHEV